MKSLYAICYLCGANSLLTLLTWKFSGRKVSWISWSGLVGCATEVRKFSRTFLKVNLDLAFSPSLRSGSLSRFMAPENWCIVIDNQKIAPSAEGITPFCSKSIDFTEDGLLHEPLREVRTFGNALCAWNSSKISVRRYSTLSCSRRSHRSTGSSQKVNSGIAELRPHGRNSAP